MFRVDNVKEKTKSVRSDRQLYDQAVLPHLVRSQVGWKNPISCCSIENLLRNSILPHSEVLEVTYVLDVGCLSDL